MDTYKYHGMYLQKKSADILSFCISFITISSYLLAFIFVTLTTSPPHFVQVGSFGPSIGQMWLPPEKGDTLKIVRTYYHDVRFFKKIPKKLN